MNPDITMILRTIGPAAPIVFSAGVVMGFLQQRYAAAVDRCREFVAQYRLLDMGDAQRANIRDTGHSTSGVAN